ncbi:LysM peptidoglycan-binding domain-containing protein [Paenibacillus sp. strain BS8-2]
MSNQNNGLRFDVYERVHLPDDVAAIDELEEIELVPRIQVIDQGDHAVLKGQLLLSGVYRSQNAIVGPLTLEHWIPVEISLPMNRVTRLDDISIEIDNFDVDLISARTLNVTGVLSLRGITVDSVEEQIQSWQEEPFTATHEREAENEELPENFGQQAQPYATDAFGNIVQGGYGAVPQFWSPPQPQQPQQDYTGRDLSPPQFQAEQDEQSYIAEASAIESGGDAREITIASQQSGSDSWLQWSALAESGQKQAQSNAEVPASGSQPWSSEIQYSAPGEQGIVRPEEEAALQSTEENYATAGEEIRIEQQEEEVLNVAIEQEQQEQISRKPEEVQIAFSGKSATGSDNGQPEVGYRAILQSSRREQALREAAEQVNQEQQEAQNSSRATAIEEEIEWKKLFLSNQPEHNEFRKIRMCIVQKEETLEQIAVRYSLNPREILNFNRLHESAVEEGQLLYIP